MPRGFFHTFFAFPMAALFIQPVFRREKAKPSRGGKQQHFGDFVRKGEAFPQSKGRSPQGTSADLGSIGSQAARVHQRTFRTPLGE